MRIATRLTLLFVFLTLIVAFTVGWFAVAMSSRAQYATLDSSINSVVESGLRNPNTALSNALYVVQRDGFDLTLDVVFPDDQITQVSTPPDPMRANAHVGQREGVARPGRRSRATFPVFAFARSTSAAATTSSSPARPRASPNRTNTWRCSSPPRPSSLPCSGSRSRAK